jgi:tRNA-Thr(GGU) m(6)t(6)A37 methyltransferase TsaA
VHITCRPIGILRTPHTQPTATPIQPVFAQGIPGRAEILPEYVDGLKDLDGFSHIYLIYHFHKAGPAQLVVTPFLDTRPHGVFATRAPVRPNGIGLSIVRLVRIEGGVVHLEDVDMLDGTPLLDIKPYTPRFDWRENVKSGWLDEIGPAIADARDDAISRAGRKPSADESPGGSPTAPTSS